MTYTKSLNNKSVGLSINAEFYAGQKIVEKVAKSQPKSWFRLFTFTV
jgi:hypothetical protein